MDVQLLLLCLVGVVVLSVVSAEDWVFDNAPGIVMEYKVHIDPNKEDCYWQYVHPGATLYVNMQVLKGGDGMAGMAIRNPRGEIVHPYQWRQSAEYEEASVTGGYYSICIDNQFSRFAGKLINLYITTFRYDIWEKFSAEVEQLDISVNNFTHSIKSVDQRIHELLMYQSHSRARESRDFQLLLENNKYVQYWSLLQCFAIIGASFMQIYCVKRFFCTNASTKSGGKA